MKVCIAYESKFGNGEKCAHYLSGAITKIGHETEVFSIRDVKPNSLPQADIYVFSSPTHVGGPPGKMKKFLKKMEIGKKEAKYALITTHMDPNTKTIEKMEALLEPKGLTKASDGLKIKVTGMKGPLEDGFEEKLDEFAANILGEK
ncbi:MAG: flavodoxin domain-containing protein [Thermoplasmata archaeon]|nr:MAG: flavodoxin domain-containing protein [Thermoplasmata archaeon]